MDDALRQKIAALRAKYGLTLPGQVESLAAAVHAWQAVPQDAAKATEAARLAHRLCGTSGSYGFAAISEAAKAVETLVRVEADAMDTKRVDAEVRRLTAAAQAAAEGRE